MKRWNFSGQGASHGNSRSHRAPGSIGMCEYPGKVWKGKKMAGHMGNQSSTVLNQRVVRIDEERSLIYILGNTPGGFGSLVKIRDAVKKSDRQMWDLQFPTYLMGQNKTDESVIDWDGGKVDPFEDFFHENDVVSGNKDEGGD